MHITASVFINDDEPGLHVDYRKWLEALAPFDASPQTYAHNRTGEDNADAHMKRQIMGREVVVAIVTDGEPAGCNATPNSTRGVVDLAREAATSSPAVRTVLIGFETGFVDRLDRIHQCQVVSYLKATGLQVGLLINFNTDWFKGHIRRIVL